MSEPNHHSLKYKRQTQPNMAYKDLKQKQKAKISEWMFQSVCEFYKENNRIPEGAELELLAKTVYAKVQGAAIWVPYESFLEVFEKKLPHFSERIAEHGIPVPPPPKMRKSEQETLAIKRANRKRKKKKEAAMRETPVLEQNDHFFFIAGYTSGGAPYGVTWEEMGLEPWQDISELDNDSTEDF